MRIAIATLGCKLNFAESSSIAQQFVRNGFTEVSPYSKGVDVCVVNTCTVTEHSDKKCRNIIRRIHKLNPGALIAVTGCYATLKKAEIEALDGVSLVLEQDKKGSIYPLCMEMLEGSPCSDAIAEHIFPACSYGERTRSFLKVQDGCNNFCAYCTVPYARGRSRNIPICQAVKQAEEIAAKGIREIVLTGVNTGDFGRSTGETFLDLLKALNEVKGIERYRISSIEPNLLTEEIVSWIASGTKFQPHFHIPLQTGTDIQLKRMGRRYTTEEFASKLEMIRRIMEKPGKEKVFFGIDVMVGLPGESDELFRRTYEFLERVRPAFIHVFPYSKRPGTPAATMPYQVSETVKKARVAELEGLCEKLHGEFVQANRGIRAEVLWESKEKGGSMSGYTGNYIRLSRPWDPALSGKITEETI